MNYHGMESYLAEALDGKLTPERRQVLESHLRHCPHCESALKECGQVMTLMQEMPLLEPQATLHADIMARVMEAAFLDPGPVSIKALPMLEPPLDLRANIMAQVRDAGLVREAVQLKPHTNLPSKPSMASTAPAQAKARFCLSWRALPCPVRRPWRTIPIRNTLRLKANRYQRPWFKRTALWVPLNAAALVLIGMMGFRVMQPLWRHLAPPVVAQSDAIPVKDPVSDKIDVPAAFKETAKVIQEPRPAPMSRSRGVKLPVAPRQAVLPEDQKVQDSVYLKLLDPEKAGEVVAIVRAGKGEILVDQSDQIVRRLVVKLTRADWAALEERLSKIGHFPDTPEWENTDFLTVEIFW